MSDVFNVYSRLECPKKRLIEFIQNELELPEKIDDVELTTINGKMQLQAVPVEEVHAKYTPTAAIKFNTEVKRVVVENDDEVTHKTVNNYEKNAGWGDRLDEDEEHNTKEVEYARLYGRGDEVIVHSQLEREMFDVLMQLAEPSIKGFVEGVILEESELNPVVVEAGGEKIDAELTIERPGEQPSDEESSVNWKQTVN